MMKKAGFTTTALNVPYAKKDVHNALQMPIYESVAFEFDSAEQIEANFKGEHLAHAYSRASNPTVEYFELKLKTLTRSRNVLAVSSGMSAISNTILTITKTGDNIISGKQLFGHTYSLFQQTLPDFGINVRFSALKSVNEIESLIDKNTRAIYFETVTNPQLEIANIDMLSEVAKRHDLLLIADSTVTPPSVFRAGKFGINVEVVSTTKFISGGATSVGGAIVEHGNYDWAKNPNFKSFIEKFGQNAFYAKLKKNIYRNTGTCMTAQTARNMIQGLDILELRVNKCYQNCIDLGAFLSAHSKVRKVGYPGLKTDPFFKEAKKYFSGIPGSVMSIDLESKEACYEFMNRLKIVRRATNLNDNKTLIIHPHSTIYAEFSKEEKNAAGIRDTMMRLSVGIENVEDLIADIVQALE